MRSLVVVTGPESEIMKTYLPSLRGRGLYMGDILIIDYEGEAVSPITQKPYELKPFSEETAEHLKNQKNIIYYKTRNVYPCLASDRMRAFYDVLNVLNLWSSYDVILITDGSDIEFFKQIQPLLEMAENGLCAFKEHIPIAVMEFYGWNPYITFPDEQIEKIKEQPMLNAGVIAGPPSQIKPLLEFMVANMKSFGSDFGSEQLSLNIWHYFHKNPVVDIGFAWNFIPSFADNAYYVVFENLLSVTEVEPKKYMLKLAMPIKRAFITPEGKEVEIGIMHMHSHLRNKFLADRCTSDFNCPADLDLSNKAFIVENLVLKPPERGVFIFNSDVFGKYFRNAIYQHKV